MVITNCHLAFTFNNGTIYKVKASIPCNPEHSYSSVIAISDFLLQNFPEILPPYPESLNELIKKETTSVFNPLCEFWNEYLIESVQKQMACRQGNQFYIIVPLDHWKGEIIKKEFFQIQNQEGLNELTGHDQIRSIFSISPIKITKKIGIYHTHPTEPSSCLPYMSMYNLFLGLLYNNQQWKIFNIPRYEVPSVEQLLTFDAIIITGSSYCVLDQTQPISLSLKNLMLAFSESKRLKIVGTCYGHQLIAHHFGSGINTKPLIGGLEAINLNKQVVHKFSFLKCLRQCEVLHLSVHHSDHVDIVPNGFQVLASSQSCTIEGLVSDNGRIYTSQFHSEQMFQYVEVLEKALRSKGINDLGYDFNVKEGLDVKNTKDSEIFLESIQTFIDS